MSRLEDVKNWVSIIGYILLMPIMAALFVVFVAVLMLAIFSPVLLAVWLIIQAIT